MPALKGEKKLKSSLPGLKCLILSIFWMSRFQGRNLNKSNGDRAKLSGWAQHHPQNPGGVCRNCPALLTTIYSAGCSHHTEILVMVMQNSGVLRLRWPLNTQSNTGNEFFLLPQRKKLEEAFFCAMLDLGLFLLGTGLPLLIQHFREDPGMIPMAHSALFLCPASAHNDCQLEGLVLLESTEEWSRKLPLADSH